MNVLERNGPQWNEWHARKQLRDGVWVRAMDCTIAERLFKFRWLDHNLKTDFCGYAFSKTLTPSQGYLGIGDHDEYRVDASFILEPDTRVPNFSTNASDAIMVAIKTGILPGSDVEEVCKLICERALLQ